MTPFAPVLVYVPGPALKENHWPNGHRRPRCNRQTTGGTTRRTTYFDYPPRCDQPKPVSYWPCTFRDHGPSFTLLLTSNFRTLKLTSARSVSSYLSSEVCGLSKRTPAVEVIASVFHWCFSMLATRIERPGEGELRLAGSALR